MATRGGAPWRRGGLTSRWSSPVPPSRCRTSCASGRLVAEARQAEQAFTAALADGTLSAAWRAWLVLRGERPARQALRDAVRTAEANAQTGLPLVGPEMPRWDASTFWARVVAEGERLAAERGHELELRLVEQARDGEVTA